MNDIRMEFLQQFGTGMAVWRGQAVSIDFFELYCRTVQYTVLNVVVVRVGVGSDDQNRVPQFFKPLPEEFDMGYHTVDIWQVGFGKQRNTHSSSPCKKRIMEQYSMKIRVILRHKYNTKGCFAQEIP